MEHPEKDENAAITLYDRGLFESDGAATVTITATGMADY
jgi:hypothetical protein